MDDVKQIALQLASNLPNIHCVEDLLKAAKEIEAYLRP